MTINFGWLLFVVPIMLFGWCAGQWHLALSDNGTLPLPCAIAGTFGSGVLFLYNALNEGEKK